MGKNAHRVLGGEDMMASASQVERNFEAFQALLPDLMSGRAGKFALMHDGAIIDFFDSMADAARFGAAKFGDEFSVQEVTTRNVSLGCYSYAMHDFRA